jgi:hypothetical protein
MYIDGIVLALCHCRAQSESAIPPCSPTAFECPRFVASYAKPRCANHISSCNISPRLALSCRTCLAVLSQTFISYLTNITASSGTRTVMTKSLTPVVRKSPSELLLRRSSGPNSAKMCSNLRVSGIQSCRKESQISMGSRVGRSTYRICCPRGP